MKNIKTAAALWGWRYKIKVEENGFVPYVSRFPFFPYYKLYKSGDKLVKLFGGSCFDVANKTREEAMKEINRFCHLLIKLKSSKKSTGSLTDIFVEESL